MITKSCMHLTINCQDMIYRLTYDQVELIKLSFHSAVHSTHSSSDLAARYKRRYS